MSRWFRHYAGMMRDEKLVRVAVRSKQPVHLVVWVWGAILESAAEINDDGRFEFDAGEAAYFLRADETDIRNIQAVLEEMAHVHQGRVVKWGDRQYQSDGAAERQKRYRERRKATSDSVRDASDVTRDVTPPSRDGVVTAQETDTDTETDITDASHPKRASEKSEFEDWYRHYPHKVGRGQAERAFSKARKTASVEELIEGVRRYVASKPADYAWRNPATWLNGQGWLDVPAAPIQRATSPPRPTEPRNPGERALLKLQEFYDDHPDDPERHEEIGNPDRQAGSSRFARDFAVQNVILGKAG